MLDFSMQRTKRARGCNVTHGAEGTPGKALYNNTEGHTQTDKHVLVNNCPFYIPTLWKTSGLPEPAISSINNLEMSLPSGPSPPEQSFDFTKKKTRRNASGGSKWGPENEPHVCGIPICGPKKGAIIWHPFWAHVGSTGPHLETLPQQCWRSLFAKFCRRHSLARMGCFNL